MMKIVLYKTKRKKKPKNLSVTYVVIGSNITAIDFVVLYEILV